MLYQLVSIFTPRGEIELLRQVVRSVLSFGPLSVPSSPKIPNICYALSQIDIAFSCMMPNLREYVIRSNLRSPIRFSHALSVCICISMNSTLCMYTHLLEYYATNSAKTNHYILAFMMRLSSFKVSCKRACYSVSFGLHIYE